MRISELMNENGKNNLKSDIDAKSVFLMSFDFQ